ncbi:MAG: FmdB family zinc ribbon protein [Vicinamibacteria bacterium]
MPLYRFCCSKCGQEFTLALSLKDHDKKKAPCPRCGSRTLEQIYESVGVITSKKS